MKNDFPIPITNENDLEFYEKYLKKEITSAKYNDPTFCAALKNYIGKRVKIECAVGNRLESRIGILSEVGDDFLVINTPNRQYIIIKLESLRFFNIMQNDANNPRYRHFNI